MPRWQKIENKSLISKNKSNISVKKKAMTDIMLQDIFKI